jgi:hypothetical protein
MAITLQVAGGRHTDNAGADDSNVLGLHDRLIISPAYIASGLAAGGHQW